MEALAPAGWPPGADLMAGEKPRVPNLFGWRRAGSVLSWLFAEPWQFDFFQALRLLEFANPEAAPPGESADPSVELVQLSVNSGLATPASEIRSLEASPEAGRPPLLRVNFSSLGGPAGPLPYPDTEQMVERSYRKDHAMRDFLDIFHNRILSLIVKVKRAHLPAFTARDPSEGNVASYLFALLGLAVYPDRTRYPREPIPARLRPLRNRLGVPDRALLYYSGILTSHPRSASGLERFFSDYFGTPCQVIQMKGIWRFLDASQWTRIGVSGQNAILGQTAMAGTRIWDQQGAIELYLGPMTLAQFIDFLPSGKGYASVCRLTAFYAGPDLLFRIRLCLNAGEVPPSRISAQPLANPTRLGWSSWLRTRPFTDNDSQVVLSPAVSSR